MRRRFGILIVVMLAIGLLVAINSVSYVTEKDKPDTELTANRSTYHAGPTGTRAIYDFLNESNYRVMRWREEPERLFTNTGERVKTFVIIGDTRVPIDDEQAELLQLWVERGGRLVIIDRQFEPQLLPKAGELKLFTHQAEYPAIDVDPADTNQMTLKVKTAAPALPTALTRNVENVLPSRYSAVIKFTDKDLPHTSGDDDEPSIPKQLQPEVVETAGSPAPVVHMVTGGNQSAPLLVDYAHGKGRIVLLSDPYIVSNGGIGQRDNLQLAVNILATSDGVTAFDEFHQGRAVTRNAMVNYFAGTPVLAIFGQLVLLILVIIWTRGRRFARPVPLPFVDRRSSLEFVASMAELQQRAKAFDLAIENVYTRTRRVLARYAGLDYNSPRSEIAARVASRSTLDAHELETLMRHSEEAINGAPITEKQSVHLVKRLRETEKALGLRMRSRELKQSAQNI